MAVNRAAVLAAEFDLAGCVGAAGSRCLGECETAQVAIRYARGLMAAQEAFRQGGSFESLAPVRQAIAALDVDSRRAPRVRCRRAAGVAGRLRAAQSELDEMRLYLESAIQMESLQRAAGQPGAPLVSAGETAGDLWLQVHRYDDARRAYVEACAASAAQRVCSLVSDVRRKAAGHGHRLCGVSRASRVVGCTAGVALLRSPKRRRRSPTAPRGR